MAKKKKKEYNKAKAFENTKKALEEGKTVTIDRDAIINIPVLGAFRDYISEVVNYLFTLKSEEETILVLTHIRENFKNVKEDAEYDPYMNSVWCLMTLLTEINHQAAKQGHTIITEEKVDETISNILTSFEIGEQRHTEGTFKENRARYAENLKETDKKKDTNED